VRAIADKVLDDHVRAVGLEGDTVIAVVDGRVLDGDTVGAVGVPPVGVLGKISGIGGTVDVDASEDDVG